MLHQLLFGSMAFDGNTKNQVFNNVIKGGYKPPHKLPEVIEDLLMGMLKYNPVERYGVDDLRMHRAFDFCRNQFASKLPRSLMDSQFDTRIKNKLNKEQVGNFDNEQSKKMKLLNQKHFISQRLLNYRNVCKFYYSNADWLFKNTPDHDLIIFLIAKRATQKFAILYYYLKNEFLPKHPDLDIENCTEEEWKFFLNSDERAGIQSEVIKDLVESGTLFEKVLTNAKITFKGSSNSIHSLLNSDMNVSYTNIMREGMVHLAFYLFDEAKTEAIRKENDPLNVQRFNVCIYLCILIDFESNIQKEKSYKLSDFTQQVRQYQVEQKTRIIESFLKKSN